MFVADRLQKKSRDSGDSGNIDSVSVEKTNKNRRVTQIPRNTVTPPRQAGLFHFFKFRRLAWWPSDAQKPVQGQCDSLVATINKCQISRNSAVFCVGIFCDGRVESHATAKCGFGEVEKIGGGGGS